VIDILKKIASQILPIEIEKGIGYMNIPISLHLYQNNYFVQSPNAIYAHTSNYTSFSTIIKKNEAYIKTAKNALILGWGLGSIGNILSKYNLNIEKNGVEIDKLMLHWYKSYNFQSNTTIHNDNIFNFVKNAKECYDIIAIDIYIDNKVPQEIFNTNFLNNINALLTNNGILFLSTFYQNKSEELESIQFCNNTLSKIFAETSYLSTKGNVMLQGKRKEN
jgi:spermidine synthase